MKRPIDSLRDALIATGCVVPLKAEAKGGSFELLLRLQPGQEAAWLAAVEHLLRAAEGAQAELILARRFVLKNDQLASGWWMSASLKGGVKALQALVDVLVATLEQHQYELVTTSVVPPAVPAPVVPEVPQPGHVPGRYTKMTKAEPREAAEGSVIQVPARVPQARLERSANGKLEVVEVPLPHTFRETNRPKPGSTRGAFSGGTTPVTATRSGVIREAVE